MKHTVRAFEQELLKLVGLGGRTVKRLTVTVEAGALPSVEVEGLQPEGQYFPDRERLINAFRLVPVGGTVESWPAGTIRYWDEVRKQWLTASPHDAFYSTAAMLATEFWSTEARRWVSTVDGEAGG